MVTHNQSTPSPDEDQQYVVEAVVAVTEIV